MDLDNIKALCEGGDTYASNDDYTNAILCWSLAAEDNADHEGKYRLGICYYDGKGVEQDIFKEKLKERLSTADIKQVKEDVLPFVRNPKELDIWSNDYFVQLAEMVRIE